MNGRTAGKKIAGAWLVLALLLALAIGAAAEGTSGVDTRSGASINVQNGSFEDEQTWTKSYDQLQQGDVPKWYTSAKEGKIELFRENTGVYIPGVTLKPADGNYAAELNADEESTLYQVLNTQPSSIYEWSLSHGARTEKDTMALIIGPNQSVQDSTASEGFKCLLSKPNKNGRDQFMQMVDWLKQSNLYDLGEGYTGGLYDQGKPIIVYSKKFGPNGTFQDNEADNAFSLTASTIYTEQWYIWLMRDKCASSGTNDWIEYGATQNLQAGGSSNNGAGEYYRYMVPAGQTQTLFGFVSVDSRQGKTYGNFLDCINFEIFYNVTASRTAHGTAKVTAEKTENNVTNQVADFEALEGSKASAYVPDQATMTLTAKIAAGDVSSVVFAGVFYKETGKDAVFWPRSQWTESKPDGGGLEYTKTFTLEKGCDLHFVFIKSPMITYDANGGDPYDCKQQPATGEAPNVYRFQPTADASGTMTVIAPYTSHAATKTDENGNPNPDWRFTGWLMIDDNDMQMINDATGEHRVACNYSFAAGSSSGNKQQQFIVIGRNDPIDPNDPLPAFTGTDTTEKVGETTYDVKRWSAEAGAKVHYDESALGLTFIAQWRWRQTYIPKVESNGAWTPSDAGGSIAVSVMQNGAATPVTTEDPEGDGIGRCYFAEQQETISVTATANNGYRFVGWYDAAGNLVTTQATLGYVVGKGDVKIYEARFVGTVKQTYIRQIPNPDPNASEAWITVTNENVAALDHTQYFESVGTTVTSTPGADTDDYVFVGWYDSSFKKVDPSFILNEKGTLSYTVTGNATYYARFVPRVRFDVRYVDSSNEVKDDPPITGETYGTVNPASVGRKLPGEVISSKASANPGYRFVGWYDGIGADKQLLGSDATYTTAMPPVGKTYYAMFTAGNNSKYAVKHIKVKPDGKPEIFSEAIINSVPTGKEVSAQAIAIPGYTYQEGQIAGTNFQSNPTGTVRGDGRLVLKLYYTPRNDTAYRIEHYQVDENGNETLYTSTDHTGKTDEWVTGKNYDADIQNALAGLGYALKEDYPKSVPEGRISVSPMLVLKLYYVRITHRVTFDRHGHGSPVKDQIVPHNGLATQPADLAELGYVFEGWYTDDTYATAYNFNAPVTQDITIHAKWSKLWTVTFDMQGHGEPGPAAQKVKNGEYAAEPTAKPTAEGYTFAGWYTSAEYTTEFNFAGTQIKRDTIVYAKWLKNITVTKVWENAGAQEVKVRLLRDGKPVMEPDPDHPGQEREAVRVLKADKINAENNWKAAWIGLPDTGRYTVQELDIPKDCTAVYSSAGENQFVVTNVGDRKLSATVTNTHSVSTIGMVIRKEWDDANNRNRPGSIRVQIKDADTGNVVQEQELNAGNHWTWTVTGLKKYHDGGKLMRYVIDEAGVNAGYMVSCDVVMEQDGSYTVKLTNVLTGKMDIGGTKLWNDGGNRDGLRPDSLYLMIYQNSVIPENLVQVVLVEPEAGETDSWGWIAQDLPIYDSFGRPITYIVVEDPVPEGYADPGPIFIQAKTP